MSKTILITGASSGIGGASARIFAKNGCRLILNARRKERLITLKKELEKDYNAEIHLLPFDVRDQKSVEENINSLPKEWNSINILLNNAGLALGLGTIDQGSIEHWDTMIDTNVKGLLYVSKATIPLLKKDGTGQIINIGSIAGKEVYDNGNVYCATKHAVDALTKAMRLALATIPIRVSAVHPGAVETEFSLVRFEGDNQKAKDAYKGYDNLVAQDIAEAVLWVSDRPKHVNINELTIMPTAQPKAGTVIKNKA
jgi:NADP-dependent 3-hydroxy acid dehydrogenase YdfG